MIGWIIAAVFGLLALTAFLALVLDPGEEPPKSTHGKGFED